jgi:hypothetical protein
VFQQKTRSLLSGTATGSLETNDDTSSCLLCLSVFCRQLVLTLEPLVDSPKITPKQ